MTVLPPLEEKELRFRFKQLPLRYAGGRNRSILTVDLEQVADTEIYVLNFRSTDSKLPFSVQTTLIDIENAVEQGELFALRAGGRVFKIEF